MTDCGIDITGIMAGVTPLNDRRQLSTAQRLVVKVGSSSVTLPSGGLNLDTVERLVAAVAARVRHGHRVVIVTSGAIAAGLAPLGLAQRPTDLATQQAAASVGQGALIAHYTEALAEHGLTAAQVLLTAEDLMRPQHYRNARRALTRLLDLGVVPIVNENDAVATEEIRFGDNDRLAALVANLVAAEALVLLSDVDGLYTAKPSDPRATLVPLVTDADELSDYQISGRGSRVGTGGMITKIDAAMIATHSGIPTLLTSAQNAQAALSGQDVGTWFRVADHRRSNRRLWLAWAAKTRGHVVLDAGAVAAVIQGKKSLLAAGITRVVGEFETGDPIELVDPNGVPVARGLAAYDADEVARMAGRSTVQLRVEMGDEYARPVVHRDDLAPVTH